MSDDGAGPTRGAEAWHHVGGGGLGSSSINIVKTLCAGVVHSGVTGSVPPGSVRSSSLVT